MSSLTRTGHFPIGFRRGESDWQEDLDELLSWAVANEFAALDLTTDGDIAAGKVTSAGLQIGAVDLPEWKGMIAAEEKIREQSIRRNADYVEACSSLGVRNFFIVMLPENPTLPRAQNFAYMLESLQQLGPALESCGGRLVIEGYPGPGALCCTPEGYRALFERCSSPAIGINYDPSHLIRMGIDPIRFLDEFVSRVFHVHAKDTELFLERIYEYGREQPPTFADTFAFGSSCWRYTIPGHGQMNWTEGFRVLERAGYAGAVSVELEDANFNGSKESEQAGLNASRLFLEGC